MTTVDGGAVENKNIVTKADGNGALPAELQEKLDSVLKVCILFSFFLI